MPQATREIKRRIRSISNTGKVTKAMELVSSAKMRRAVQAVLASRAYANQAWELVLNLAERTDPEQHSLLQRSTSPTVCLILISSNRGLVGGFNAQLITKAREYLQNVVGGATMNGNVVLYGKKGRTLVTKFHYQGVAEFEKMDVVTRVEEVRPLARLVIDDFKNKKFGRVVLAYTDFVSTLIQRSIVKQLLPIQRDFGLGSVGPHSGAAAPGAYISEYVFEPNPDVVLEALLPRLVEMQLYQAVAESNASEHAARMVAMRNASDAANDLIDDLTLSFNQARQAAITQDLAEISASRATLES